MEALTLQRRWWKEGEACTNRDEEAQKEGEMDSYEEKIRWIDRGDRLPTADDADRWGCVLALHSMQGAIVTHWKLVEGNRFIYAWTHTPKGPHIKDTYSYRAF